MAQKSEAKPRGLEDAIERINAIVSEMEQGELPLDALIARFEEGIGLVKSCQEKLDAAERKIEIILRDARGDAVISDFKPGTDADRA